MLVGENHQRMRKQTSRRSFLATSGTVLAATLAGCSGDTEGDSASGSKDSTTTKEKASGSKETTTTTTSSSETTTEESTTESTTMQTTTTKEASKALEIVEHEAYEKEYSSGVKGIVKNNGDKELSYVEVSVKFMDSEGTLLTSGLDNVNGLGAGQKWAFDAMYTGMNDGGFEDYEIEVSTGF